MRGIEVSDDALSFETIRKIVEGEGCFLGHAQTRQSMTCDYLYPEIADRSMPQNWVRAQRARHPQTARGWTTTGMRAA